MTSRPSRSLDDYAARVQKCMSPEELFALLDDEMHKEGYHNIVFARIFGQPDRLEVAYCNLPEGDLRLYFDEHVQESDPVVTASQTSTLPLAWIDVMMRQSQSEAARRAMEFSAAIGIQGGLTIPFHRPGGNWDLISLSMRDRSLLDASRIPIVNLKAYATVQRYLELEDGDRAMPVVTAKHVKQRKGKQVTGTARTAPCCAHHSANHPQHGKGVGTIEDRECRALVLADIGWRRHSAGLLSLNERLPDIIGTGDLRSFIARGLIEEEPDDFRFAYVFKPSAIGKSHLRTCPQVASWRNEVWSRYVKADERPVD